MKTESILEISFSLKSYDRLMQSIIGGRNGCQARVRLNIVKEKFYLSDYAWHASACTCNSYFQRIEELEGFRLAINSGTVCC